MEDRDAAVGGEAPSQVSGRLLNFLNRLDEAHIYYTLGHTRPGSVMVDVSRPGWRGEVEFMIDGSVETERYESVSGVEGDPGLLEDLFADPGPS